MDRLLLLTFFLGFVSLGFAKTVNTLADTVFVQRYDTLCQGDTLKLFGRIYIQSGKYRYKKPTIKPTFDTVVVINLLVRPRYKTERFDTLCQGEQILIGTQQFSSAGTYTVVFPANNQRCDSIVKLNLYILPVYAQRVRVPLCMGDTMRLGSEQYYYPTLATLRYSAKNGCDSVVQYDIQMLDTFRTQLNVVACKGEKVKVGNDNLVARTSGAYYYNYGPSNLRCDSLIELKLEVLDTFLTQVKERICSGQTRQLGPLRINTPGLYRYTFPPNQRRCDSTVLLDLSILPRQEINLQRDICEGDTLIVGSEKISHAGFYLINLKTKEGCDSIINLNVKLRSRIRSTLSELICNGDTYLFGRRRLSEPGIYFDTLSSRITGCDSIVRLDLSRASSESKVINAAICQGQSYAFDNKILQNPGIYVDTLQNPGDCPVLFELHLKVNPVFQHNVQATICKGSTYQIGTTLYSKAGSFTKVLKSAKGCDSTIQLQLSLLPNYLDTMRTAICVGDTFRFGQLKLFKEGAYPIRFNTRNGCDSILVVKIVHYPTQQDTFPVSLCAGDTFRLGRLKFHQTGMYPISLRDRNSCDSTLYIQVTSHPRYQLQVNQQACEGRVVRFGKQVLTRTGTYIETFRSRAGCDSVVTLKLELEPIDTSIKQGGLLLSASVASSIRRYEWIDCATQKVASTLSSPFFLPESNGRYAVRLYTDTCVYTSGCHTVQVSTSTRQFDFSEQIQYYPNPCNRELHLKLPGTLTGQYQLTWINSTGKVINSEKKWLNTENEFNTETLSNGLYLLRLQKIDESAWATMKFIKAK
ncbi:MAG: T9SS type A sorting domain-containing protein [Haliscomenobacter sp.]|uniref:T9SS type A sorting domain-containing protein n=1 Tax=Haliscomenobacter sp. TaxID=2717303 RepID=UPI0029BEF60F|nr:T9SS type A sorting domain-containing protein [Haliscomenobacter sp.]MDX2072509.1 T9SS type A sorting domain-containing protein [Haliscomenobacter sp.]